MNKKLYFWSKSVFMKFLLTDITNKRPNFYFLFFRCHKQTTNNSLINIKMLYYHCFIVVLYV